MKTKDCEVCGDRMAVRGEEDLGGPIQSNPTTPAFLFPKTYGCEKWTYGKIRILLDLWNVARASRLRSHIVRSQARRLTYMNTCENPCGFV